MLIVGVLLAGRQVQKWGDTPLPSGGGGGGAGAAEAGSMGRTAPSSGTWRCWIGVTFSSLTSQHSGLKNRGVRFKFVSCRIAHMASQQREKVKMRDFSQSLLS